MMAGVYAANCFIVSDEQTGSCFIIDPGGDADDIIRYCEEQKLQPRFILLTHGHGDHIAGAPELVERYALPIYVHAEEALLLSDPSVNMSMFMPITPVALTADRLLHNKEIVEEGPFSFRVLHTPGHTGGSASFLIDGHLFAGDTLFRRNIGRTDLATGSMDKMEETLRCVLLPLDDDIIVHCGHGEDTTMGYEKEKNPFLSKYTRGHRRR